LIATYRLGDLASILGLLATLVGFAFTLWNVSRSKRAAEDAEKAVQRMREAITQTNTISEFSAAVVIMDEIKRLHRAAAWTVLPDRYSALKRSLITIRSANPSLSDNHKTVLQGAILHFTALEQKVEAVIASKSPPPNVAKLNKIVSSQIELLSEVLTELREKMGR
jgi:hypothetical protein